MSIDRRVAGRRRRFCTLSANGERKGSREQKCMAPNEREMDTQIDRWREKGRGRVKRGNSKKGKTNESKKLILPK